MKKINLLLLIFIYSVSFANAQWQETTLDYADVNCLTSFGTNLFAGTFSNGVILSKDNGINWNNHSKGITDSSNSNVRGLGVMGTTVFAGTLDGLFLSNDSGANWAVINDSVISGNNGTSFAALGSNLFAGTGGGGVFLSADTGKSWMAVDSGLTDKYENALAVSGTNIFAGTYLGIFLSSDTGKTWVQVNNGLTNTQINALAASGTTIFAGTNNGGVYKSADTGASWTLAATITQVTSFAISGGYMFAGTIGGGVYISTNGGSNWMAINTGLTQMYVTALTINGDYLFAGTNGGVWKRHLSEFVGMEENNTDNVFSLYPNPATNQLTIHPVGWASNGVNTSSFHNEAVTVSIMNMLGQITSPPFSLTPNPSPGGEGSAIIDVSRLPAGMYFLQLKSESGSVVKKFVKE